MRAVTYLIMVVLVSAALFTGQIVLGLIAGGIKALLVGLEFMELRHAARPHAVVYTLWVLAITGLLLILT